MSETQLLSLISFLGLLLCGVFGWLGNRIFKKLDDFEAKRSTADLEFRKEIMGVCLNFQEQIHRGDNVLHDRITVLDRRVTKVETRCDISHGKPEGL